MLVSLAVGEMSNEQQRKNTKHSKGRITTSFASIYRLGLFSFNMNYSLLQHCLYMIFLLDGVYSFAIKKSNRSIESTKLYSSNASVTKVRICTGSSCLGKCMGAFNPLESFKTLQSGAKDCTNIEIEEAFCLNQCKRGPNARIIKDDTVLTFDKMNEIEMKRKSFQNICNDDRVEFVWNLATLATNEEVSYEKSGDAKSLSDILPS